MIDYKSTLKIALNSLKVNKMRSILTSLGIIIGVGAVIIMLAIGSGANKQVQENLKRLKVEYVEVQLVRLIFVLLCFFLGICC